MKSARTTLAYVAAGLTVAFGLLALLNPRVAVRVVGLEVMEVRGLSEIRATYGAMFLMMGGTLLWAVPARPRSAPWLRFAALLFGAAAVGRLASLVLDGAWDLVNLAILLVGAFVSVALFLASFQTPRRDGDGPPSGPRRRRRRRDGPPAAEAVEGTEETPDPLRAYRS